MATSAWAPAHMGTASENTRIILDAISGLRKEMSDGLGAVNVTTAALGVNVANVQKDITELSDKVDRLDSVKAPRADLVAAENRIHQTISEMKAQIKLDIGQVDKDKIAKTEFSVDSFDNVVERLNEIDAKLDDLNKFKWKLMGAYSVLVFLGALLGWVIRANVTVAR